VFFLVVLVEDDDKLTRRLLISFVSRSNDNNRPSCSLSFFWFIA
jgi:hypothetical protein